MKHREACHSTVGLAGGATGATGRWPARGLINTGGQLHRGLGSGCFKAQGAQRIAHAQVEAGMRNRGNASRVYLEQERARA